ncbi:MAG: apolipoprotein N-acyltransferase [Pseudomonadota bacterium]
MPRWHLIAALLLGAVSVFGFAPFYVFVIPLFSLAGLIWLWRHQSTAGQAILSGFLFGLGYFGSGVSWIYISLHTYGAMAWPLALLATSLFCAFLALFPAAVGGLQHYLRKAGMARWLLAVPALWMLTEWVRGWIFTGFPWLAIGYSQVPASPLAGFAPLVGVYGVSLLLAFSATVLALGRMRFVLMAAILWVGGWGLSQIHWTQPIGAPLAVSLLQGNIPQDMKWQPEKVVDTLRDYRAMVADSPGKLIILPETAIPVFYDQVPASYLNDLAETARAHGGDVLVGIPEQLHDGRYFNSVMSFGTAPTHTYRKFHLVPFGEYIPAKWLFGWIIDVLHIPLSDFARGDAYQVPMPVAGQHVAVNICYEDAFGEEIIHQLPRASLLVNVSNDAWFGDSVAPWQHLQISQMRALEAGRYMLRATNTGATAIINTQGRVLHELPLFTRATLNGSAQGYQGETPFVAWGNHAALLFGALMLIAAGIGVWRKKT